MPVITIDMWKGRTDEQKEKIIKGITKVFEDINVSKENTTIIIHEVDKSDWGTKGVQASKA